MLRLILKTAGLAASLGWSAIAAPAQVEARNAAPPPVAAPNAVEGATAPIARPAMRRRYADLDTLPDWSGVWENLSGKFMDRFSGGSDPDERQRFTPSPPPYNAEYRERYAAITNNRAVGRISYDPTANCLWPGLPWLMFHPFPLEFVFEPGMIRTNHEYMSQVRRIFTNGRGHPAALEPSFNGHSTGWWEGDTLVVETAGFRADTQLQGTGMLHSDAMTMRERIHLIGPDILENEITIRDPKAFTGPYVSKRHYRRHRDWEMMEYVCQENNRDGRSEGGPD